MLKALVIKALAIGAALTLLWVLPGRWGVLGAVAVALAAIGFLTYAIAYPGSQFFAPVVSRLATAEPIVALTFDDGPDPVFTAQILDLLAAHRARATFFVLGERAQRHPELILRMHRDGHAVGTHTQHHRLRFHFGTPTYVQREIEEAIAVVAGILPTSPTLFRPPQGLRTPCFAWGWSRMKGLTCVTWSVRGLDSLATTAEAIVARVTKHLAPGVIVTLHDGTGLGGGSDRAPTLAALETILATCETRGLRCVALGDVMAGAGERARASGS